MPSDVTGAPAARTSQVLAVIDIGSSSIRLHIASANADGTVRPLETARQTVELGKDTFKKGEIAPETTERCAATLRSFRRLLDEYGVTDPAQIRAVATTAVREAANGDAFLDRLYIATGVNVEAIDEGEVNRYTYLSVKPVLDTDPAFRKADALVVEVGGGGTRFLALKAGRVAVAQSHRMGALRIREMLEGIRAPTSRIPDLLASQVESAVKEIRHSVPLSGKPAILMLGNDVRFAASILQENWNPETATRIRVSSLAKLADSLLRKPIDEIVRTHRLSYPDAETLGPALLTYVRLAEAFDLPSVFATGASVRDGIVAEMVRDTWTDELTAQVENSATELGHRYGFELVHGRNVARAARAMFRVLQPEHRLAARHELLLVVAALLHEIGLYVSNRSHHKHSMYLIRNSDIFGLGDRDKEIAALVARYHRKALPQANHPEYMAMDRDSRLVVSKLAAILRVADALDRRHGGEDLDPRFELADGRLLVALRGVPDTIVEEIGLHMKGDLFREVYGLAVALQTETA
jgi:exopolyphosphatase/guanosine-5'-triphosphate,3'-diphosphate pyrophosphatase